MYSLKCDYYKKEFNYLHELVDDVLISGMDPNPSMTQPRPFYTFPKVYTKNCEPPVPLA
jgi:hypothetical protein